ncbi:MAG: TonB C-terminal domain-containing protein [Burkholderiales bacterium]
MPALADRFEFMPPQQGGLVRGFGLALLAHGLLVAALTWGINWKSQPQTVLAEAELWSSLPQQAAPKPVELPPAAPAPVIAPAPVTPPAPAPPALREAEIALERAKQKKLQDDQNAAQARQRAEQQREAEKKLAIKKAEDLKLAQAKAADQTKEEEAKLKKQREDNLRRIASLAGATGAPSAIGTAPQAAGLSQSYQARLQARVQPNIVAAEDLPPHLVAEVEVRSSPEGIIISRALIKSSGNPVWDNIVLRAIDKTAFLPRDENGKVPSPLSIKFRPRN